MTTAKGHRESISEPGRVASGRAGHAYSSDVAVGTSARQTVDAIGAGMRGDLERGES
jgi:hypothetical protein